MDWRISPGSGWRPICFFEKIFFPDTVTSNTPPEEGIRRSEPTSCFFALSTSSATRTACGRYPQLVQYSMDTSSFAAIPHTSRARSLP